MLQGTTSRMHSHTGKMLRHFRFQILEEEINTLPAAIIKSLNSWNLWLGGTHWWTLFCTLQAHEPKCHQQVFQLFTGTLQLYVIYKYVSIPMVLTHRGLEQEDLRHHQLERYVFILLYMLAMESLCRKYIVIQSIQGIFALSLQMGPFDPSYSLCQHSLPAPFFYLSYHWNMRCH